ncbi:hypothetical protein GOP47_0027798 [Adiantum capillus-veneris]|nr:hypothetical protein GOP47_0027798 [Adiantum capillus-veneris]
MQTAAANSETAAATQTITGLEKDPSHGLENAPDVMTTVEIPASGHRNKRQAQKIPLVSLIGLDKQELGTQESKKKIPVQTQFLLELSPESGWKDYDFLRDEPLVTDITQEKETSNAQPPRALRAGHWVNQTRVVSEGKQAK